MDSVRSSAGPAAEQQILEIVERARKVPDSLREFTESADRAIRFYAVPETVVASLVAAGFPVAGGGGRMLFDRRDLRNILLRARLPSPQWNLVTSAARALHPARPEPHTAKVLEVVGRCPERKSDHQCDLDLHPSVQEASGASVERVSMGHYRIEARVQAGPPTCLSLSEEEQQLFQSVAEFEFQHLPEALTADLGFLRETRLADCRLATRYLTQEAAGRGIRMRSAAGLFLARPLPMTHSWIEVWKANNWQPADPFFLTALVRWGLVPPHEWPIDRSPRGVLWRLGSRDLPLMTHGGEAVDPMVAME